MAVIEWRSASSGSIGVASNWVQGTVPTAHDRAVIDKAGTYSVVANNGAAYTIGSVHINAPATTSVTLSVAGASLTVNNNVGNSGTVQVGSAAGASSSFSVGGNLVNHGDVTLFFSGIINVTGETHNDGNISDQFRNGQLNLHGDVTNSGRIDLNHSFGGEQAHIYGDVLNKAGGNLGSGGAGTPFEIDGAVTNFGNLNAIASGTFHLHSGLANHNFADAGGAGTLIVDGMLKNTGLLQAAVAGTMQLGDVVNSGSIVDTGEVVGGSPRPSTITASGDVTNQDTGSIQILVGSSFTIAGALSNFGTVTADGAATSSSLLDVDGATRNDGTLQATGGGSIHLEETARNLDGGLILADGAGSTVTVDGDVLNVLGATIKASNSATVELKAAVLNQGDLIADDGTLKIDGALTGQGSTMIVDAGIVDLGAVAHADLGFSGATAGELILHDSSDFRGDVSGFADTDKIDFKDFLFGSTTVDYTPNAGNTGGQLLLTDQTDPSHHAAIHFVGTYDGSNFAAADDGSGHLLVQHQV